jgi:hypothetical protein
MAQMRAEHHRGRIASPTVGRWSLSDALPETSFVLKGSIRNFAGSWTIELRLLSVMCRALLPSNKSTFAQLVLGGQRGRPRQVAGILLGNWLKGRRRAVWISKSDKLIEDARRD